MPVVPFPSTHAGLAIACAASDREADARVEPGAAEWNAWLAENASRFLLFARQQTRCGQDAEDVLQDALVESWRRSGGKPEAALVFATIRRRAIDLARRSSRRLLRERAHGEEIPLFCPPVQGDSSEETTAALEKALRELPGSQREVLTLKFWGGLTFAEVAETLEIPQGTAASRYRLALEALRSHLKAFDCLSSFP